MVPLLSRFLPLSGRGRDSRADVRRATVAVATTEAPPSRSAGVREPFRTGRQPNRRRAALRPRRWGRCCASFRRVFGAFRPVLGEAGVGFTLAPALLVAPRSRFGGGERGAPRPEVGRGGRRRTVVRVGAARPRPLPPPLLRPGGGPAASPHPPSPAERAAEQAVLEVPIRPGSQDARIERGGAEVGAERLHLGRLFGAVEARGSPRSGRRGPRRGARPRSRSRGS